jgi:hypothetical protein
MFTHAKPISNVPHDPTREDLSTISHDQNGITDVKDELSTISHDQRMGSRMSRMS